MAFEAPELFNGKATTDKEIKFLSAMFCLRQIGSEYWEIIDPLIRKLKKGAPAPDCLSYDDEDVMREAALAAAKVIRRKLQLGVGSFRKLGTPPNPLFSPPKAKKGRASSTGKARKRKTT